MPSVPSTVLVTFFQEATSELKKATLDTSSSSKEKSLKDIQQDLLKIQIAALNKVVANFDNVSAEQVQAALKNIADYADDDASVQEGNAEMNEAARFAFCRLVLHQECVLWYQQEVSTDRALINKGTIDRAALMEFCGLCTVAMKMPHVREHLKDGTPLFGVEARSESNPIPASMEKRLERIQKHMMTAVGYDTEFGTAEFQRIFLTPQTPNEFSQDTQVAEAFGKLIASTQEAMANILLQQNPLSDKDDGGVTRVVSVNYSEKEVDASTIASGDIPSVGAPRQESMNGGAAEAAQRKQLQMAKQAAALQQKILGELMSMEEGQRKETLEMAQKTSDKVTKEVMQYPTPHERMAYMQSMDATTQKHLLMHKIWAGMKQANGGKEPTFAKA